MKLGKFSMKRTMLAVTALVPTILVVPAAQSGNPTCFGKTPTYIGTSGDDVIYAGPDNPVIYAKGGNDTVYVQDDDQAETTWLCLGDGNDTVTGAFFRINGDGGYDRASVNVCWAGQAAVNYWGEPKLYKVESVTLTPCTMTR